MSNTEKIGEDILGGAQSSRLSPKKLAELEQKLKEELSRNEKKKMEEEEEKLPDLPIPSYRHVPKPGELGYDELAEEVKEKLREGKDVHVDEHFRSKPKKRKQN